MNLQREGFQIADEVANLGKAVAAKMDADGVPSKRVREIIYFAVRGGGVSAMRTVWRDLWVELEETLSRLATDAGEGSEPAKDT